QFDIEKLTDVAQAGRYRIGRALKAFGKDLGAPLNGERPQVPLGQRAVILAAIRPGHLEVPECAGIAVLRTRALLDRCDQEVGDVVKSADRAIPIKQGLDSAP